MFHSFEFFKHSVPTEHSLMRQMEQIARIFTTPHHTTLHYTTPHHTHHTTPYHTTPHHTALQHTTPNHTAPHHTTSQQISHHTTPHILQREKANHVGSVDRIISFCLWGSFCWHSGDMVGSFVSNSHLWRRPGARVMAIFVSHVGIHFSNIGDFEVYGGI